MPVMILLTSGHGPHPGVEVITDDPSARRMVAALAAFLRSCPVWRGGGALALHIGHPRAVAETFVPATSVVSVERLESDAAMAWHPHGERAASVAMIDWYRDVREDLGAHLRDLALQPPELPFPRDG
jgi:hypothetical protein